MSIYRERVYPGPWVFIMTALVIPASLLVFLPINLTLGVFVAAILYLACVALLLLASPLVEVTDSTFIAGRARLPRNYVGEATAFRGSAATRARGQELDARAWLVIRGWVSPVVKVQVLDENDPAPYWLVSTRRPDDLVKALNS